MNLVLKRVLVCIGFLTTWTVINSQDVVFNDTGFFKDPYFNFSILAPSLKLDERDLQSKVVAIPFKFPAEALLSPELSRLNSKPLDVQTSSLVPNSSFHANQFLFFESSFTNSGNFTIITYENNRSSGNASENIHSRMPAQWQNNSSPLVHTNPGAVFMVVKKNMGLNFDLSIRLMGNQGGNVVAESMGSGLKFSYRLANNFWKQFESSGFNVFLGLSGLQRLDDRTLAFLRQDLTFPTGKARSVYVNPGFTLSTRNLILEGTFQLPVYQNTSIGDVDTLWKYEYQGRLGMKWYLPEFIKP